ncbi:MAG: hypothetical protein ACI9HE_002159 [Planctomycetota bacterium]|jgi:hypothetical protein
MFRSRPSAPFLASIVLTLLASGCNSGGMAWRSISFAEAEDVLGDSGPVLELTGALPQAFLAGSGEALLLARRELLSSQPKALFTSVLDLSRLDAAGALALSDAALNEALEVDGLLLLDHSGATVSALLDSRTGVWLVRVNKKSEVVAELEWHGTAISSKASAELLGLQAKD